MSFAARPHLNAVVAAGLPALGTMIVEAFTLPDTVAISFNSDGTISSPDDYPVGPPRWYTSTVVGIGASYRIRFTLNAGTPWDAGLVSGTLYDLNVARSLALSSSSGDKTNLVDVEIVEIASGLTVTTGALSMGVYVEA